MNIHLNSFSNYAVSFLKESVLPSLSTQHKKILVIASLALGFWAACYALRHCLPTRKSIEKPNLKPNLKPIEEPSEKLIEKQIEKPEECKDEVLKRHGRKVYCDPNLVEYAQLSQPLILKLEKKVDDTQRIVNTGLTELLIHYTFTSDSLKFDDLHDLLKALVEEALIHHNSHAKLALTRPNNPQNKLEDLEGAGFPQNTPLALLVKAGNLEGSQLILPVYGKEDLLFTTPRGNTVLHLALVTGQMKLAAAIMNRAKELNILSELLNMKNRVDTTADDLLSLFQSKDHLFKNFLDVVNPCLGGDEINKAWIGFHTDLDLFYNCRNRLFSELKDITEHAYSFAELQNLNLTAISQMI